MFYFLRGKTNDRTPLLHLALDTKCWLLYRLQHGSTNKNIHRWPRRSGLTGTHQRLMPT